MEKGKARGLYTMIGPGSVFEGTLSVPHSVRVDGTIKGRLQTEETLTVGPSGVVEADVVAQSAIVGGKVIGNLSVEDRVELEANSSLNGDLKTRELVINEGARFDGNCAMKPDGEVRI
jgi:cytoskeletal protein CcmA (bactofilin family)